MDLYKRFTLIFLIISLLSICVYSNQVIEDEFLREIRGMYPKLKSDDDAKDFIKIMEHHAKMMMNAKNNTSEKRLGEIIVPFHCTPFDKNSVPAPTSVHDVKLPHIDLIGAIGDSITAGFGAKSWWVFDMLTEYRGISWSIGGDDSLSKGILTLPNLIRLYNPSLYGFSTGTGKATTKNAYFNQAVSGATAKDLLGQSMELFKLMRVTPNFQTSYKLITVFIGGNDLCAACTDIWSYMPSSYEYNIRETLTFLKNNFPNTIVNLVPAIDVTELAQLRAGLCDILHYFECDCYGDLGMKILQKAYVEVAKNVSSDPFFTTDTFTVVLQPFMNNTFVPQKNGAPDMDFFAMDCFHLSELGHQAVTVPFWNNIFEKVGEKFDYWEGPREQFHCPSKDDFIWTSRNSNITRKI
eukprot:TRINITY_DN289_c0_g1_i1.p1 TRINITY_DN289_c0_g1~~TRINITY_DN289_c0_g1_i1.p1  ORF type:complete len:418 (-),score=90.17 TRINITY_DN289_c0_g1_i1:46-1272(-)